MGAGEFNPGKVAFRVQNKITSLPPGEPITKVEKKEKKRSGIGLLIPRIFRLSKRKPRTSEVKSLSPRRVGLFHLNFTSKKKRVLSNDKIPPSKKLPGEVEKDSESFIRVQMKIRKGERMGYNDIARRYLELSGTTHVTLASEKVIDMNKSNNRREFMTSARFNSPNRRRDLDS